MSTEKLADFAAALQYSDLSAPTVRKTKQCILDWLGVCIRGSQEKPIVIIQDILRKQGGNAQATVLNETAEVTSASMAAFANGSASHSLDFDDLHNPSIIHLATVVIPPAFALAQAEHKSGQELLTAVVAGYEVGARVGESVQPESYFYWHTTATAGTFGAGAAAGSILGLDKQDMRNCLGSAGTQAAGLWEFLKEGAMSKTLHAGKSSQAGVLSAYLAQAGFTGASQIMEGVKGFCRAMVKEPKLEKLTEGLGSGNYKIDENSFKPYACCKHSHAAIFAIISLCKEHGLSMIDVAQIRLHVNNITEFLINNSAPNNPYGCKFSIQYCVAGAVKYGKMGVEEFAPELIGAQDVRELMQHVEIIKDPAIEAIFAQDPAKLATKVEIVTKTGQGYSMLVEYPKGDPPNPMTWEDTVEKFRSLVQPVYGTVRTEKLVTLIDGLEQYPDFDAALRSCLEE